MTRLDRVSDKEKSKTKVYRDKISIDHTRLWDLGKGDFKPILLPGWS